ncbi:MAG: MFS transporter [Acidimicrobiia bacterium]|nr:MFS transporter [Acidimicrobiia bacterium]
MFVRGFGLNEGIEWGFWLALTVFWIIELGLGPLQLVFLGIALETTVLLSETPTGVVADLHSRKRSVLIAQVLMGISFIWSVASTNYWVILPAQILVGFGWTFRSGADTAWVTDELKGLGEFDDDDVEHLLLRKHRFGILVAIFSLMFTMIVGTLTSVRWVAAILGMLYIAMAFYFQRNMREDHFTPGHEEDRGFVETLRKGVGVVSGRPRLRVLVVVILLVDFGAEAFDRLGYKHFLDSAEVSDDSLVVLGLLFLILAFAGLAVNAASSRVLSRGHGVARLTVVLLAVAAIGGFIASITSIVVVIAFGYLLQDSVREALWPVLEGWANRDAPSEVRATVHSLMGQTTSMGELVGGIALGTVAELVTIPVALTVAALFFAAAAAVATRGIAPRTHQPA